MVAARDARAWAADGGLHGIGDAQRDAAHATAAMRERAEGNARGDGDRHRHDDDEQMLAGELQKSHLWSAATASRRSSILHAYRTNIQKRRGVHIQSRSARSLAVSSRA